MEDIRIIKALNGLLFTVCSSKIRLIFLTQPCIDILKETAEDVRLGKIKFINFDFRLHDIKFLSRPVLTKSSISFGLSRLKIHNFLAARTSV